MVKYLKDFGVPEDHFAVDLTIARGLDYYTGTVYETQMTEHPEVGSICSGGRYDDLAGFYTDKSLPGVGISIGLTRLFFLLNDRGLLDRALPTAPADVLILPMTEERAFAVETATAFRAAGIRTQIYSENKKFKARMTYANRLGVPFVAILGDDELEKRMVSLKDMRTGTQELLTVSGAAERAAAFVERSRGLPPIKE